jgi:hypothetical protein
MTMTHPEDASEPSSAVVLVFSTTSIPEGHLVKGLLESEGITVTIKGESEGPYRMGPVYLWVPEALETRARLIIEDARSTNQAQTDELQDEGP